MEVVVPGAHRCFQAVRKLIRRFAEQRILIHVQLAVVVRKIVGSEQRCESIVEGVHMRGRVEGAVVSAREPLEWALARRGDTQLLTYLARVVVFGDGSGSQAPIGGREGKLVRVPEERSE